MLEIWSMSLYIKQHELFIFLWLRFYKWSQLYTVSYYNIIIMQSFRCTYMITHNGMRHISNNDTPGVAIQCEKLIGVPNEHETNKLHRCYFGDNSVQIVL